MLFLFSLFSYIYLTIFLKRFSFFCGDWYGAAICPKISPGLNEIAPLTFTNNCQNCSCEYEIIPNHPIMFSDVVLSVGCMYVLYYMIKRDYG